MCSECASGGARVTARVSVRARGAGARGCGAGAAGSRPPGVPGQRRARRSERTSHPAPRRPRSWGGARGQSAGGAAVPDPLPLEEELTVSESRTCAGGFSPPGAGEGGGKGAGRGRGVSTATFRKGVWGVPAAFVRGREQVGSRADRRGRTRVRGSICHFLVCRFPPPLLPGFLDWPPPNGPRLFLSGSPF